MPNDKLTATDELPPVNQGTSDNQLTATDTLPPVGATTGAAPTVSAPVHLPEVVIPKYYGFTPGNLLKAGWEGLKSIPAMAVEAGHDLVHSDTPILLDDKAGNTLADKMQGNTLLNKYVLAPAAAEKEKAQTSQTPWESIGHSVAEALPVIGPLASHLAERAGTGDIGGATAEGAGMVAGGKLMEVGGKKLSTHLKSFGEVPGADQYEPYPIDEAIRDRGQEPGLMQNHEVPKSKEPVPPAKEPHPLGRVAYPDATAQPVAPTEYGLVGNDYTPETTEAVPPAKEPNPLGRVAYPESEPAPKPARGKAPVPVATGHTPENLGSVEPTGFKSAAETGEALAMRPPKSPALGEIKYGGEKPASETGEALGTIQTNRPITPEVVEESKAAKAAEQPKPVAANASGESAASQEAINRQASEKAKGLKRVEIDTRKPNAEPRPLIGADAVDAQPSHPHAVVGIVHPDGTFEEVARGDKAGRVPEKLGAPAEAAKEPAKNGSIPYDQIADSHNKNRGFTFNPKEGFVRDQKVYSVGGEHPDLVKVIKGRKLTPEDIREFAERPEVKKVLDADPRNSIGGWNYKGNAHLEISKLFHDKDYAIQAAKDLNQTSIYDHGTRSEIPTGGTAADEEASRAGVNTPKVGLDARRAEIADAFEKMEHNPNDPKVKASYEALKKETLEQLEQMKKDGIKVVPTDEDPYGFTGDKPAEQQLFDDIKNNKTLKVWRGGNPLMEGHPLAEVEPKTGENFNTLFRAVHDYYGHFIPNNDFSEAGEENAHNVHSQQFSKEARPAMTTETKGQTSWFFNNKGVRGGEPLGKFAEQKAGLLPEEYQTNKSEAAEEKPAAKPAEAAEEKQEGLTDSMKRQMEHRLGKNIAEKLSGTPDGIEKAMRLLKGTNQQFADIANEHGPFKPGDVNSFWEAADFSRKGSKDLSPMKAKVIEHLVNQVPTKEFMDATKDWGQAQKLEEKMEGKGPAPEATAETAKMSDEELLKRGFTKEDIAAGKHLPSVKGGGAAAPAPAKEGPQIPEKVAEKMTARELEGVSKSPKKMKNFLDTMEKIPEVQEYIDIALQGEGARRWYPRSGQAFDALKEHAPQYFDEPGDKEKFLGMLAGSSPRQSVAMNLRETLRTWSAWVDAGRPEVTPDSWKEYVEKAKENYEKAGSPKGQKFWDFRPKGSKWKGETLLAENLAPAMSKAPNVALALTDTDMWPDLSKNMNFKVPSFADNLRKWLNDAKEEVKNSKSVTNDGWMALFGGLDPGEISHADKYHPMSVATRAAADTLGWEPEEAQAAIWSFTQALTEKGETSPEMIRQYSEDFADLLANDKQVRGYLQDMGVDLERFDERLRKVEAKPEVTGRTTASTSRSVEKLKGRIEQARGKGAIPAPKSEAGLFDSFRERPAHESRVRDTDTEFNPEELEDEDRRRKK